MTEGSLAERWLARIVNARDDIAQRPRRRVLVAALCAGLLAGTGVADALADQQLSLAVAYLIPITLATVLLGRLAGLTVSTLSLAELLAADVLSTGGVSTGVAVVNDLLRFLIFLFVVFLLSALHNSVLSARKANQRGREFLAYAAHQLRTPLSGMSTASQALLLDPDPSEREALLAVISRETARAGRLVTSLLRIARLDQGEPLQMQETDVRGLLDEVVARWRPRWPQLQLILTPDANVAAHARFARDACREILDNLFENACRHAKSQVVLCVVARRDGLEFRVSDDGPGLPLGQEDRAFDRFVSLDGRGGSGLGLPIARQLARANGGDVIYRSGMFVVTLPGQPGSSPRPPQAVLAGQPEES